MAGAQGTLQQLKVSIVGKGEVSEKTGWVFYDLKAPVCPFLTDVVFSGMETRQDINVFCSLELHYNLNTCVC